MSKMWEWSGWADGWYPSDCYDYQSKMKKSNECCLVLLLLDYVNPILYSCPQGPWPNPPQTHISTSNTATIINAPSTISKLQPTWEHPQIFVNLNQYEWMNMNAPTNIWNLPPRRLPPQIFVNHNQHECTHKYLKPASDMIASSNICTPQPTWMHPKIFVNRNWQDGLHKYL